MQSGFYHISGNTTQTYRWGILARYTDTNNWVWWGFTGDGSQKLFGTALIKRLGGTVTTVWDSISSAGGDPGDPSHGDAGGGSSAVVWANLWWGLRLTITAGGFWVGQLNVAGSQWFTIASGYDANFASGTLSSGKVGIYDCKTDAAANIRSYGAFQAWVPGKDAVAFASQSVDLRTIQQVREDSTGTAWSPVSYVLGDLPRIPPATVDGRSTEVFLKMSRGDLQSLADPAIDNLSARVNYRPSWLFLGEP